jgi:hypothetical protein
MRCAGRAERRPEPPANGSQYLTPRLPDARRAALSRLRPLEIAGAHPRLDLASPEPARPVCAAETEATRLAQGREITGM